MKNLDITSGVWHKESGGYDGIHSGPLAKDRISHKTEQGEGNPVEVPGLLRQPINRGQRVPCLELPYLALPDGRQATTPARVGAFPKHPQNGTFQNLRAILMAAARRILTACLVVLFLCSGCTQSTKRTPMPPPAMKARIEALIDSALKLRENKATMVPYELFKQAVLVSIDVWEAYGICVVDRQELVEVGAIDLAEAQGRINAESARADANARIAWYVAGGGLVLSIITFLVGAFAL